MMHINWKQKAGNLALLGLLTASMAACGDTPDNDQTQNNTPDPEDCQSFDEFDRNIESALTLDGCYMVNSDVEVTGDGHLTIMPGSVLLFAENVGLEVHNEGILTAEGTATDGILLKGQEASAGFWRGIQFRYATSPDNKLDYVTIDGGGSEDNFGSGEPANLGITQDVRLTMTNSTLKNSREWGLYGSYHASNAKFTEFSGNTLTANASGPASLDLNILDSLDSSTDYSGNDADLVVVTGKVLDEDATWKALNVPYRVTDQAETSDNALTIEAGAIFEFDANQGLKISSAGSLTAVGEEDNPIIFRGSDAAPKFWRGLKFINTPSLENKLIHVEIDGGGSLTDNFGGGTVPANLALDQETRLTLKNSTIKNSEGWGIFSTSKVRFTEFSGNTLTGNADGPASLDLHVVGSLESDPTSESDFSGNDIDRLVITGGNISEAATWKALNVPYRVRDGFKVNGPAAKLTIEPGAILEFDENKELRVVVNGTLTAVGTADAPIIFRGSDEAPKYWGGIDFSGTEKVDNKLIHVEIDGGGSEVAFGDMAANLMLNNNAQITLENATLTNPESRQIYLARNTSFHSCSNVDISGSAIVGDDDAIDAGNLACGF